MSDVKMCDRCAVIFPVTTEGRSSVKGTVHRKFNDGSSYEENITRDFCGNCTADMNGTSKVPMPAIQNVEVPTQ